MKFGEEGTVQLVYCAHSKATWKGPATDHKYRTEQVGDVLDVDVRDAECMTDWHDNDGFPYFGYHQPELV